MGYSVLTLVAQPNRTPIGDLLVLGYALYPPTVDLGAVLPKFMVPVGYPVL